MHAKISASAEILNYGRYIRFVVGPLETDGSAPSPNRTPYPLAPDKIRVSAPSAAGVYDTRDRRSAGKESS